MSAMSDNGQWQVERWGGKPSHKTRVIFIGSEFMARAHYKDAAWKLRDGTATLLNSKGEVVERTSGFGCQRRRLS
jgi:hypothetical protein